MLNKRHQGSCRTLVCALVQQPPQKHGQMNEVEKPAADATGCRGASFAPTTACSKTCWTRIRENAVLAEKIPSSGSPTRTGAIATAARKPRVWLQASTATIYAHRCDSPNDEHSGILGGAEPGAPDSWRFSIDVARAWERAFEEAVTDGTRKVALRSAMTLSPDRGGVFDTLLGLARHGLGRSAGDGRQFMSWIHHEDFIAAVCWLIDLDAIEGAVNVAAPNPLPNAEFMRILRAACGVRRGLPANKWMLEIGAVFMRTDTELILKSRRVVPARLLEHGFKFRYPDWWGAAVDLCHQSTVARDKAFAA